MIKLTSRNLPEVSADTLSINIVTLLDGIPIAHLDGVKLVARSIFLELRVAELESLTAMLTRSNEQLRLDLANSLFRLPAAEEEHNA